jgi:hypothetical protein
MKALTHPDIWTMWFSLFVCIIVVLDWFMRAWKYWYVHTTPYTLWSIRPVYPQWGWRYYNINLGRIVFGIYIKRSWTTSRYRKEDQ